LTAYYLQTNVRRHFIVVLLFCCSLTLYS